MKDVLPSRAPIRFGVFELDPESGELRKQGLKVRLQDQPSQILRILLEHPGKVVTREELRQRIWPSDTFVDFNQGLYNATKKLREALGDSAQVPRYIETLSRRGYRFIGTVNGGSTAGPPAENVPSQAPTTDTPEPRSVVWIGVWLVAVTVLLLFVLMGLKPVWRQFSGKDTALQIRSLAVLPLQNLSTDPAQEYFSDGMTDALITDLAQIGSLKVISRTSIMHYKDTDKTLPEIARELSVDGIVEGTVQRSGDRVRITAQLIHGPSDKHIWAKSYERDMRDVFALERDVAEDIADQVQTRLMMPKQVLPSQPRPVDPEVLEAYVQGNYHLEGRGRGGGDEEEKTAEAYFKRAIDLDANFALAYIGLARSYELRSRRNPEDLPIERRAAEKAVELDPFSSDAECMLGDVKSAVWDRPGAEEAYRRAIALNPNNAAAHDSLGEVLDQVGELDKGWKEFQIAQELDPKQDYLADPFYRRGLFDRAIEIRQRIAVRDPGFGYNHYALAMNYAQKQRFKEFVLEMGKAATLYGMPEVSARLQHAYDQSGGQGALRQWAEELERFAAKRQLYLPRDLAELYATLGDRERAFYWLEEYRQHHDLATAEPVGCFKTDPWLAPIRSDPRFSDFLDRIGLPP